MRAECLARHLERGIVEPNLALGLLSEYDTAVVPSDSSAPRRTVAPDVLDAGLERIAAALGAS